MNRPAAIWSVLAACALLIVGAMAWATLKALDLESKQAEAEEAADLEERIRLSLNRIDTAAAALLVLENQRPPHHFKAFYEPEDVFTKRLQIVGKGIVVQPSPLLGEPPRFVRLHFEIRPDRNLESPQVPTGNERDLAEQAGIPRAVLDGAATELEALRRLLGGKVASTAGQDLNLDRMQLAVAAPEAANWANPTEEQVEQKEASIANARLDSQRRARQSKTYQQDLTYVEKSKRAKRYNESLKQAAANSLPNTVGQGGEGEIFSRNTLRDVPESSAPRAAPSTGDAEASPRLELGLAVTPFRPVWVAGELFAARQVTTAAGVRFQGVWFQSAELEQFLLRSATDLPHASLEKIPEISAATLGDAFEARLKELSDDPLALVTFPWRLHPGEFATTATIGWTALRMSLTVGWGALLLALLAAAFLVGGVMKLSERRAAFVSSVTHELRTPLTTFHLYSDLLAEGMVQDEAKKQNYLETMRREATRLNHLIENVLTYSRIERGSARARHETITLEALVERMRPRLEERTRKDEAELRVTSSPECRKLTLETDLTAIEQIVFNLVDNACKYGLPDEGERLIELNARNGDRHARIEVCDRGGGIDRTDLKRLFRPFHKSACDAAHSKPGVGLGLALSRRLAGALGGSLRLEPRDGAGACFVVNLPVKRKST